MDSHNHHKTAAFGELKNTCFISYPLEAPSPPSHLQIDERVPPPSCTDEGILYFYELLELQFQCRLALPDPVFPYLCKQCDLRLNKHNWLIHIVNHLVLSLYRCRMCGVEFGHVEDLMFHVIACHASQKECPVCKDELRNSKHVARHLKLRGALCPLCSTRVAEETLMSHIMDCVEYNKLHTRFHFDEQSGMLEITKRIPMNNYIYRNFVLQEKGTK